MMRRLMMMVLWGFWGVAIWAQAPNYYSLMSLAKSHFEQKEYAKSNECYEQVCAELKGTNYESMIPTVRNSIAINNLYMGVNALNNMNFPTAKDYLDKAIKDAKPDSKAYYMAHSWMGQWNSVQALNIRTNRGNYEQAVKFSLEAERYFDLAQAPEKRLKEQLSRAAALVKLSRIDEAETLLKQILIECEGFNNRSLIMGKALYSLGDVEMSSERFQMAIQHLEQSYNLCNANTSKDAKTCAYLAANKLSSLYTKNIPDNDKENLWKQRANELESQTLMTAVPQLNKEAVAAYIEDVKAYEQAVNNIVEDCQYEKGVAVLTTLIERCEKNPNYPSKELADYFSARGQGLFRMNQFEQAVDDYKLALELYTKAGEAGKSNLSLTWYKLAIAYYNIKKANETMQAADKCIQIATEYFGPTHSETMKAYGLRSNIAGFYNKKDIALHDRQEIFNIIRQNIERNFVYLTTPERTAYWNKYMPETTIMFAIAQKMNERESAFTDALFNQQLLAKGLLLTAESSLQRAIERDEKLKTAYQEIRQLRKKAADARTLPKEASEATLKGDRLERALGASASTLYQFLDFLKVSGKDIHARLKPTDIAVEFVDYRVGKDSTMYAALVMSPSWEHVRFLPLIEAREIPQFSNNLTERIWKPILEVAGNNVKDIYFSPTGLLYQLPIESHTLADGRSIGEAYRLHRLSSTRWLAQNISNDEGKDAIIFGGLAYNTSISEMKQDAMRYPQARQIRSAEHKMRGAISGLDYLPETKTEAEAIAKTINSSSAKRLHADLMIGKDGTETSFKSLDGQHKQIVHIATHGFYNADDTASDPLTRCGLYFAGADNILQGEAIPTGVDDGVLTAQEISSLDLRGLNLVALSACQTGDGEITDDGIFGLQRGFKKAGAQSLLMSLWPVSDAATCLLMTEFYRNWIAEKMSKHDALEKAKQAVRSHKEQNWDNPKYWAAFILLDGLD